MRYHYVQRSLVREQPLRGIPRFCLGLMYFTFILCPPTPHLPILPQVIYTELISTPIFRQGVSGCCKLILKDQVETVTDMSPPPLPPPPHIQQNETLCCMAANMHIHYQDSGVVCTWKDQEVKGSCWFYQNIIAGRNLWESPPMLTPSPSTSHIFTPRWQLA